MTIPCAKRSAVGSYDIQPLGPEDRCRIVNHLLALKESDRTLRFGLISDADAVARYVATIDFERDAVFGAVDRRSGALVGVAHVGLAAGVAELGLSVSSSARCGGVGRALASAALREAQRRGAHEFRFDSVASNSGMRRLAQRLGMPIRAEGSEFVASRSLAEAAVAIS